MDSIGIFNNIFRVCNQIIVLDLNLQNLFYTTNHKSSKFSFFNKMMSDSKKLKFPKFLQFLRLRLVILFFVPFFCFYVCVFVFCLCMCVCVCVYCVLCKAAKDVSINSVFFFESIRMKTTQRFQGVFYFAAFLLNCFFFVFSVFFIPTLNVGFYF